MFAPLGQPLFDDRWIFSDNLLLLVWREKALSPQHTDAQFISELTTFVHLDIFSRQ